MQSKLSDGPPAWFLADGVLHIDMRLVTDFTTQLDRMAGQGTCAAVLRGTGGLKVIH